MPDVFANITAVPEDMLNVIGDILEARAEIPSQREMLKDYMSSVSIPDGAAVLEVGCGTGPVCRFIAGLAKVAKVVGVDPSPALLARARELADGIDGLDFEEGDGASLRFDDASFDVVVFHTLLSHIPQPETVLAEALRILKPAGTLALCDGDFSTTTVQTGPNDPLQVCAEAFVDNFVTDKWLVRRMSVLTQSVGFDVNPIRSYGLIETTSPGLTLSWIDRGADALAAEGRIGPDLAEALKAEGRRRGEEGSFYAYMAYAALTARKPA